MFKQKISHWNIIFIKNFMSLLLIIIGITCFASITYAAEFVISSDLANVNLEGDMVLESAPSLIASLSLEYSTGQFSVRGIYATKFALNDQYPDKDSLNHVCLYGFYDVANDNINVYRLGPAIGYYYWTWSAQKHDWITDSIIDIRASEANVCIGGQAQIMSHQTGLSILGLFGSKFSLLELRAQTQFSDMLGGHFIYRSLKLNCGDFQPEYKEYGLGIQLVFE
ncbi:MAG: hypothetical protein K6U03_01110 [Firmicutes bacterium]|nr:hypothetical protein [Bacillota bacterium]